MAAAPRRTRRLAAAVAVSGLFAAVAACGSEPSQPLDPADTNVESDDILPPGTQVPAGTGDEPEMIEDEPMGGSGSRGGRGY